MKHSAKKTLARRMMSRQEVLDHCPPFRSKAWRARADARFIKCSKEAFNIKNIANKLKDFKDNFKESPKKLNNL